MATLIIKSAAVIFETNYHYAPYVRTVTVGNRTMPLEGSQIPIEQDIFSKVEYHFGIGRGGAQTNMKNLLVGNIAYSGDQQLKDGVFMLAKDARNRMLVGVASPAFMFAQPNISRILVDDSHHCISPDEASSKKELLVIHRDSANKLHVNAGDGVFLTRTIGVLKIT